MCVWHLNTFTSEIARFPHPCVPASRSDRVLGHTSAMRTAVFDAADWSCTRLGSSFVTRRRWILGNFLPCTGATTHLRNSAPPLQVATILHTRRLSCGTDGMSPPHQEYSYAPPSPPITPPHYRAVAPRSWQRCQDIQRHWARSTAKQTRRDNRNHKRSCDREQP